MAVGNSPYLRGFRFSSPAQFRREAPTIVRRYGSGAITVPTRTVSVERSYFIGIDRNRNGLIEEDELTEVSPAASRTIYTQIDTDTDGVVSYDELYGSKWCTQAVVDDSFITPAYTYRHYAPTK